MNPKSDTTPLQPKTAQPIEYPFKVVCSLCQKTIIYSGKNGEVSTTVCDECAGI